MNYLLAHSTDLTVLLFAVLGLFSAIAKITPTETDNKILAKVLAFVHTLGLTK